MGMVSFTFPNHLDAGGLAALERACVAGGPDNMPWPTEVRLEPGKLTVRRSVDDSGYLMVPWEIRDFGRLMGATATLMERPSPYDMLIELARGKVNQVRCQLADWRAGGLQVSPELQKQVREASLAFGRAVVGAPSETTAAETQEVLAEGYKSADRLVRLYTEQVFHLRKQRQPRLDTGLGFRLDSAPSNPTESNLVREASNTVALTFSWKDAEPTEGSYQWDAHDAALKWATENKLKVSAGPLIDFAATRLPDWLWLWERDLQSLARFMTQYVTAVIRRYRNQIRRWQLTGMSNCANVLALGEDELLWLTVRLIEAARDVDPDLEFLFGVSQPWGEYMAVEDRTHSPFIFADTIVRTGINLSALDVELVMGIQPRGSYCRDLLETSRLLDLYSLLGLPVRVTLGYPSAATPDMHADPDLQVNYGWWRTGFTPEVQADWIQNFASLALCKPYVDSVLWCQPSDARPHHFPHCGLIDASGKPKPAAEPLKDLRAKHLR